ncbi:MAG: hypothetical protein CL943_00855 [Candidatus Diapherotrites archaeon]|uniref:Uncharacterized protein n=1 Tax=Candidatus Iainarchaeum sp. TaxID=3101447 RepID=A0A2D6M088_9ARCH|nr:hypothetical protein [Candidatus Diapherotrites archaeon]
MPAVSAQTCGDGSCDPGENSCTCQADCGTCGGTLAGQACKEFACTEKNICKLTPIPNCCGNDLCEVNEGFADCPADCLPSKLEFELLGPVESESFYRGELVLFKVKATGDGINILGADITLSGFFGSRILYNDGKHEDGTSLDAIYANRFLVKKETLAGKYSFQLEADFREVLGEVDYNFSVEPVLDIETGLKEKYALGDIIDLSGTVQKRQGRFAMPLTVKINNGREDIFVDEISSDVNGKFASSYHSSLIDRTGMWTVTIEGEDENKNTVSFQTEIKIVDAEESLFIQIGLVEELGEAYERISSVEIIAEVKDFQGGLVEGAELELEWAGGKEPLLELKSGQYSGTFFIPFSMALGANQFALNAKKSGETGFLSGSNTFIFNVESAEIDVEIMEPSDKHYNIGESLAPKVFASYANGEPVIGATVVALLNNKEITLENREAGIFSKDYSLSEEDKGRLNISFRAVDSAGNEGLSTTWVEVSGESLAHIIQQNAMLIAVVLIIVTVIGFFGSRFLFGMTTKSTLEKRKKELNALEKEIQSQYFDKGELSKKEYQKLMEKYQSELETIDVKLVEMKKSEK